MNFKKPIRLFWGENYSEKPAVVNKAIDKAVNDTVNKLSLYPDELYVKAQEMMAESVGLEKDNVILGHGIEGLIHLTSDTYLTNNKAGGLFRPSFFVFESNLSRVNSVAYSCRYDEQVDLVKFMKKIKNTSLFFLASPNTATGNYLLSRSQIEKILRSYKGIFVVDECYFGIGNQTVADLIDKYSNLIVYRGLTKVAGMASLRLGFAISNKEIVKKLNYNFRKIELDPINSFSLSVFIETYPHFDLLVKNTNRFFGDFIDLMEKDFPEDKIIRNLTTFHFMDIRKYNIPAYKVMNYMNEHGYLFSSDNKTSNEGINFPEFIELTPPPREYWDDFSNTLRKALT